MAGRARTTNRICVRTALHHVLELRPEVVDRFDAVSDLCDVLDVAVELVDGGDALAEILKEEKGGKKGQSGSSGLARASTELVDGATTSEQLAVAFRAACHDPKQPLNLFEARSSTEKGQTRRRTSAISATSLSRSRSKSLLSA
jgi:hypothetical protein